LNFELCTLTFEPQLDQAVVIGFEDQSTKHKVQIAISEEIERWIIILHAESLV
jgi:hypothetical protein